MALTLLNRLKQKAIDAFNNTTAGKVINTGRNIIQSPKFQQGIQNIKNTPLSEFNPFTSIFTPGQSDARDALKMTGDIIQSIPDMPKVQINEDELSGNKLLDMMIKAQRDKLNLGTDIVNTAVTPVIRDYGETASKVGEQKKLDVWDALNIVDAGTPGIPETAIAKMGAVPFLGGLVRKGGKEFVEDTTERAVRKGGLEKIGNFIDNLKPENIDPQRIYKNAIKDTPASMPQPFKGPQMPSPDELAKSDRVAENMTTGLVKSTKEMVSDANMKRDLEEANKIVADVENFLKEKNKVKVVRDKTGLEKTLEELESVRASGFKKIDEASQTILEKNGLGPDDLRGVMEGRFPDVPAEDIAKLREIDNKILEISGGQSSIENHFPHISTDVEEKLTFNSSYGGKLTSDVYDSEKMRKNLIPEEKLISSSKALKQSYDTALSKKYGDAVQAQKIMVENNLPAEKGDEVLEFVKKESENNKTLNTEHLEKTPFGKSHDYIEDAKRYDTELAKVLERPVERPVVAPNGNFLDPVIDKIRIDDTFFQQRTNEEIWKAFQVLRDSGLPDSPVNRKTALGLFIETATKYDYQDKYVKNVINNFIDGELKANKIIEGVGSKLIRLATSFFSGAHIGGNLKTVITQPTEIFRVITEEGADNVADGIRSLVADPKRIETRYGLNDLTAQHLAEKPEWKEALKKNGLLDLVGNANESVLNVTMSGMKFTEELKNMVLASTVEQRGLKMGLKLDSVEMTRFVRDELFRVGHIGAKYSTPQFIKNNPITAGLAQYSQYALKNFVLKYDTVLNKADEKRLYKVGAQIVADTMATISVAIATGVPIKSVYELFKNSSLPTGFGPLVTVPFEYAKEAYQYVQDVNSEKENPESLGSRWADTTKRNFMPVGNQYQKTKGGFNALFKGYDESKKGNINFPTGDLNPIQKAQVVLFGKGAIPNKQEADKLWKAKEAGTSNVYPTLTGKDSEIFKSLPKDQQEAFYDKKLEEQAVTEKGLVEPKRKLTDLFKKKEVKEESSKIKDFYFKQGDATSKDAGIRKKAFSALETVMSDTTLPDEYKQKVIEASGASKEDVEYYHLASQEQEERLAGLLEYASGETDRQKLVDNIIMDKRMVAGKAIVSTAMVDRLYDEGLISKEEKKLISATKWDSVFGKFYMDRDYAGGDASAVKAKVKSINALFKDTFTQNTPKLKTSTPSVDTQTKSVKAPKLNLAFKKKTGNNKSTKLWFNS